MFNVVFETVPPNKANIFKEINPVICVLVHNNELDIIDTYIYYKEETEEIAELRGPTTEKFKFTQIENMNSVNFARAVLKDLKDSYITAPVNYDFDPMFISGTYLATDAVRRAMNQIFKEDKNRKWEMCSLLDLGFSSQDHLELAALRLFNNEKNVVDEFDESMDKRAYLKALVSYPV